VDRILDDCVLWEQYERNTGLQGQSFSLYDASRKAWHQTWVTNRGELLVIEGGLIAGEMILSGVERLPDGQVRHVRGKWRPNDGGVREIAVLSNDGEKTWHSWFDLVFRPHKQER
jgi:hypothetical protein